MAFRSFRTPESSNIVTVAYCASKQELHVEFNDGRLYEYAEVPPAVAGEMFTAESVGTYFNKNVRPTYKTTRRSAPCGVDVDAAEVQA